MSRDRDKYHHNKGQKDKSKGKYDPPHSRIEDTINSIIGGEPKSYRRDREQYDKGRRNTKRQKGGCFLTTACVERAGLPDNCRELQLLRRFRDSYMRSHPHGDALLAEYYRQAPFILEHIQASPEVAQVLDSVLADIRGAVKLIEAGDHQGALRAYVILFVRLNKQYGELRDTEGGEPA